MIALGANSSATNKFGMTPLHHAAVNGSADVIKCLLEGGCAVNQADNAGRLPLHWAATKVRILLFILKIWKYVIPKTKDCHR